MSDIRDTTFEEVIDNIQVVSPPDRPTGSRPTGTTGMGSGGGPADD